MSTSAGFLGLLGAGTLFFTHTFLSALRLPTEGAADALVSVVGMLYLGFAVLNWMAREKPIGGIYSRPVALGNFAHFLGGTIVLGKQVTTVSVPLAFATLGAAYAVFAVGFGYLVFGKGGSCG